MTRTLPSSARRAFSLLEAVIAASVLAVLAGGMGSVFVIASHALPSARGATEATVGAASALEQVLSELRTATTVTETTATSITFTVPDRDRDLVPETIRYSWQGPGTPLTRELNGGDAVPLTAPIAGFSLAYKRRTEPATKVVQTLVDSGETLLSSFNGWSGITPSVNTAGLSSTLAAAEAFAIDRVTFPADTVKWYISKVSVRTAKPLTSGASVTVAVCRPASAGSPIPGAQVGSPGIIPMGVLAVAPNWRDATFADVIFTDTTVQNLVLQFKATGGSAQIEYLSSFSAPVDAYTFLWSSDGGSSWQPASNRQRNDARFFVYGGYERMVQTTVATTAYFLGSVQVMLQPTADASTRVDSGVSIPNQPSIPAP